jgi:hypothetical protein
MNATLPTWAADIVTNPPRSPGGFHNWLFCAARALWKCGRSEYDIRSILESAAANCGRFVPQREIDDAIRNSQVSALQPLSVRHRPWPALNREQREAVIQKAKFSLVDLWEASPVKFRDNEQHTEEIIDSLFRGNPLLCCGKTQADFATRPRSQWRGELSKQQFLVPSPMIAWVGRTQQGKDSAHTKANTGSRWFLVIEQDTGSVDEQAAVLWYLASLAPLLLVVHSGGKSVHSWFHCKDQDEEKILRPFMRVAVLLGADHSTWTRSQFVRMPDGTRADGKRQAVYYFRPEVIR